MEKKQGSLQIETAEGSEELEISLTGERVGLATMLSALKQKLKDYGLKDLAARPLVLSLHIGPPPPEPGEEEKERARNAERYPDSPPGQAPRL